MTFSLKLITSEAQWEDFVLSHSPQALFQSWLWGEVQENLGVKVWRLGVYQDGKLVGVLQVIKTTAKRGKFLHVRHGPIFLDQKMAYWKETLAYLTNLARLEGSWFVRLSPLVPDSERLQHLLQTFHLRPAPMHAMDAELCWVLDLNKTEAELLAGMRKTTRYEIKKAQKTAVKVSQSQTKKDLDVFLKLYEETTTRHGFVPHQGIREEFRVFTAQNKALLFLGKVGGKVSAGAIILFYGDQAIYHHGASTWSKLPVSYLVQWEAIREAKKRGYKLYNFWGIAPDDKPNHPWRGITLFKTGFGGREVRYLHAQDLPISPLYLIPATVETVRRIVKGY